MAYYVVFSALAISAFINNFSIERCQKLFFFVCAFFLLVLFAAFRGDGFDYNTYLRVFTDLDRSNNIFSFSENNSYYYIEPGFRFIVKLFSFILSPVYIFFAIAFLSVFINFYCFKKYSPYVFLTIILYFVHTFLLREMIQIRAGLACSICLYSLIYIEQKKILQFMFLILLSISIHSASIIFCLAYVFYQFNVSTKTLAILLGIALYVGLSMPLGQLITWIPNEKLTIYANSALASKSIGVFNNPTVIKSLVFVIIGLVFYERMRKLLPHFCVLFHTYYISLLWMLLFNDFSIIAGRIATFFSITEIILVPSYMLLLKKDLFHILIMHIIIVIFAGLTLYLNISTENIPPYIFRLTSH
jgi:hypothetical protein